ncbi:type VI secretion system lipoprotein TssJ [Pseudenhygromyxa sp. WMMC2535]|uniref:type VI secretion system lipoprotein TssJ n=1 Tax=Pseudenhygromyxa sp. WMMC2535 TaxID=2712867 RepID=UPI00155646F4|nr:type VI secretion system lipoprotein TssJ [Pseudenhygromyxa sp. WMMC2535]NVB36781.1 type VI secretion system lipoprotein TssJ [Pseudenhygromyxa sp. WMMC2535]
MFKPAILRSIPVCGLALGLAASLALGACKKKRERETCNPDDYAFEEITVLLQAASDLNPDDEGAPLSVVVRMYQLSGDLATRSLDVAELWEDAEAALGDEYIADSELTLNPEGVEAIPVTLEKETRHVLVVGGFRQPVGNTWYRVYEIPDTYGKQACEDKREGKNPDDLGQPCVYLFFERNQVDGGKNVPPGFDKAKVEQTCTPVYSPKTVQAE